MDFLHLTLLIGGVIGVALVAAILGSNAIQKDILQELRAGKGFSAAGAAAELPQYAASAALEAPIPNRNEVLAIAAPCIAEVMGKDVTGLRIVSIKKVG
ncbi:hypothetical protein SDC9_77921 [bioreactor metagenome]|uniref:Uncharacterized protein n=1 Tax=bioreactor metagenome TaxID=1076179 RepID=A0A644YS73_9ZZZZ